MKILNLIFIGSVLFVSTNVSAEIINSNWQTVRDNLVTTESSTSSFNTSHAANKTTSGIVYKTVQTGQVVDVPIPASVWLFCSGLIGLIGISRRRH